MEMENPGPFSLLGTTKLLSREHRPENLWPVEALRPVKPFHRSEPGKPFYIREFYTRELMEEALMEVEVPDREENFEDAEMGDENVGSL